MNDENSAKKLTVYLFLDENLVVGLLLRELLDNENVIYDQNHKSMINNVEKSKEIKEMITKLYEVPIKIIALESSLEGAIEKIKSRGEYRRYNINFQKIEKLRRILHKSRYGDFYNGKEYYIRINGICLHVITRDAEKQYVDDYNKKHEGIEELVKRIFDNGDLHIIKTLVSYADKRNGKGIYIFLTLDKRIIKKFSNYLSRLIRKRIYMIFPEDLRRELENLKILPAQYNLQEILYNLNTNYLAKSLEENGKK